MAKEKKIGVIAIAVLSVVFVVVVVMKLTGKDDQTAMAADGQPRIALKPQETPKLASGPQRPRYLTAEKDAGQAPVTSPDLRRASQTPGHTTDPYRRRNSAVAQTVSDRSISASSQPASTDDTNDRYTGRYADSGTEATRLTTDGTVDPFSARRAAGAATDETAPPTDDSWASAADGNLPAGPGEPADVGSAQQNQHNPLRMDSGEPLRLAGAELPTHPTPTATLRTPSAEGAGLGANQAVPGGYNAPSGQTPGLTVAQHTQDSAGQFPPYQRQNASSFNATPDATAPSSASYRQDIAPGTYVVGPNDNYWAISEAAYGTGKYFKALYEHNRDRYPAADDLHVGDSLDVPALAKLEEMYADLCPKRRRATQQPRGYSVSSGALSGRGGQGYVVQEGDTLFNIAREQLGKAARWAELYELNRDALGDDIDFVSPGMRLVLPGDIAPKRDILTRRPGGPLQR